MTGINELEQVLEEFMEYGLAPMLLSNSVSSLLAIAMYVLSSLGLYTLAKRRGLKNPWLSWVPVINCWIIGSLSDQYRYVVKGQVKNKRKTLLILSIILVVIYLAVIVCCGVMFVNMLQAVINGASEDALLEIVLGPAMAMLGLCLPMMGVAIATMVIHYMAMYDIYTSCMPQNNVLFLVLSILFSVTEAFFIFFSREKDEGMPPRKQEFHYAQAKVTWSEPEHQ